MRRRRRSGSGGPSPRTRQSRGFRPIALSPSPLRKLWPDPARTTRRGYGCRTSSGSPVSSQAGIIGRLSLQLCRFAWNNQPNLVETGRRGEIRVRSALRRRRARTTQPTLRQAAMLVTSAALGRRGRRDETRGWMFGQIRGLARLGLRSRRLVCDEQDRAFRPLEQLRRNLAKEKLVAGPRAHADHRRS